MKPEFVMVNSVIQGPFNPEFDSDIWALLCNLQTQDGKVTVDEIRGPSFKELYDLKTFVETYGPKQVEMNWIEA